jgi:glutamate-1-semialdehyde 2,1-aminomutase
MSALHRVGVPVYGHRFGAKGCLVFAAQPIRDYREFLAVDGNFSHAHWLIQHNGGVFLPPWGKSEQWTLSAQHGLDDADRFIANVERMTSELALLDSWMPDPTHHGFF